ncbi:Co2 resistance protein CorC [Helicobacter ailurogastricus]|uniref:Hemolysins and related proteins containing CBS domains n=2 Tax=Helicobacter ailurogastricus TaxID=1578720 RepID=A0A0K2X411_9HELI|nr:Hemolysins and related proteins containing CBS domains [Helicobacter ailurogastricus]CRF42936.1 Hemolysins and related proteins containing CBS domains [Helicobacter ailurogastricus]CRF45006.1 Hemolysins and related proteins containing CBS domains [Helicobacter ailurogastricus]CRF52327.1 Hemolysins and related proteins containing CBS domains [Helicobacter ailurogastricus]BDQ29453.1 membrane protein [Helicobacter ailurogastricus]
MEFYESVAMCALAFFLVLCNAFFVLSEFAIVKVRRSKLEELSLHNNPNATLALKINASVNTYLSATQLGVTLASLGLGWLGEPALAHLITLMLQKWVHFSGLNAFVHGLSVVLAFCLITLLHVILGEIVPKSIAIVQAERMVLWVARPLHAFWLLSYPIVNLFDFLAKLVLKLVGIEPQRDSAHSEEEIKIIVGESLKGGVIDYVEEELIKNAVDFSDTSAREIMTPRNDMVCLDTKQSHEQHLQTILKHPFTRYPCCEGHKDNILGVVHIKDILSTPILERKEPDLKRLLQEVLIVPESASISQILIKMNQQKMRMALVVDEYGGTSGVLTMDDIFEEIMGNIFEGQNENKEGIKRLDEHSFECDGRVDLESIEEFLGFRFARHYEQVTLGGYVFSLLERLPEVGDVVGDEHCIFEVLDMDKARISKLKLVKKDL